jgi:putative flippase GtrA
MGNYLQITRMRQFLILHKEKIAYLITGVWNTLIGYGAFALLYYLLSHTLHSIVILTLSYVISITNSYIGYKLFVFKTKGSVLKEYLKFYVVYGGGYLINITTFPYLVFYLKVNPYVAQVIITGFTVASSYFFHKNYSFRNNVKQDN